MKENTQEKALINVNKKSVFLKIKNFLKNLFDKNIVVEEDTRFVSTANDFKMKKKQNDFLKNLKNIDNTENKLLELQNMYRQGKIDENDMTKEQIELLCNLYDKQIIHLKESNEIRKQKLFEYRNKLQKNNY